MVSSPMLSYQLDAADLIVETGGQWDAFAEANGSPELTRTSVLGRSLFDFISGAETREVARLLLVRARSGILVDVGFRCDSPTARRFLRLTLRGQPGAGVECSSRVLREEARSYQALLDLSSCRSEATIRICSWCKRIRIGGTGDGWSEIEDAVDALGVFEASSVPRLNHGICPACRAGFAGQPYQR